jgi:hypothetical protein
MGSWRLSTPRCARLNGRGARSHIARSHMACSDIARSDIARSHMVRSDILLSVPGLASFCHISVLILGGCYLRLESGFNILGASCLQAYSG